MSTGNDGALADVLQGAAAEARPARLPEDLWSRGRRRHRLRVSAAVAVTAVLALVVAMPAVFGSGWRRAAPANDRPSVPSRVYPPMPLLQSTVQESAPGPAALILTGPGGFGANDSFGYEDRALVVGRNGSYRWVRNVNSVNAGESVLLSPDGRYIAGDRYQEGTQPGDDPWAFLTSVVDLTTGHVRTYEAGVPLAWSPGGRSLLTRTREGLLRVLEVESGAIVDLGVFGGAPEGSPIAFSPDGRRVALQVDHAVHIVDLVARTKRTLADLGDRRILAGPGAWTADGRIAVWRLLDCESSCATTETVGFDLAYVDAERGTDVNGPRFGTFPARGSRLLGWQSDGDAVVVRYHDARTADHSRPPDAPSDSAEWPEPNHAAPLVTRPEVMALRPGGGSTTLVSLPGDVDRVDVARDLLDRFGGPPPAIPARLLDWLGPLSDEIALLAVVAAAIYGLRLLRRRIRTGSWRQFPGGTRRRVEFPRRF